MIGSVLSLIVATGVLTDSLQAATVTGSLKNARPAELQPVALTTIGMVRMEKEGINGLEDVTAVIPNFYKPQYGSSMTASLYVRGFGSRIDNPAMAMYIDGLPVMDKNLFDTEFYDMRSVEMLRGPQGTLYGRNSGGGVMLLQTISPLAWQGVRASVDYDVKGSVAAKAGWYTMLGENKGLSVSGGYKRSAGYFKNEYDGRTVDGGLEGFGRVRFQWLGDNGWSVDNILSASYVDEGGYAYQQYFPETGELAGVNTNDTCYYRRTSVMAGVNIKHLGDKVNFSSATSFQFLKDRMHTDNDFSAKDYFVMFQDQNSRMLTEEALLRRADKDARWQWVFGAFGFAKWLDMHSPVDFNQDGINDLILYHVNQAISKMMPNSGLDMHDFTVYCDFDIPTFGGAIFHQSEYKIGHFTLTGGVRLDVEKTRMSYDSNVNYDYQMTVMGRATGYHALDTAFVGKRSKTFVEFMPKAAVTYDFAKGNVYASVAKGYKAGGFNTQIFADIMQELLKNQLMGSRNMTQYMSHVYDDASATEYKPEESWNFEIGTHLKPVNGLSVNATAFLIECRNQQVTVMPEGNAAGRLMSNAAKSRSVGFEASADYRLPDGWAFNASWGFTNAKFRDYQCDAETNYKGKHLPYAPQNTISLSAGKDWTFKGFVDGLYVGGRYDMVGKIWWNESNELSQPLYGLLSARVTLRHKNAALSFYGRNLTDTDYKVFYFKSVSREFYAKGLPITAGVKLTVAL